MRLGGSGSISATVDPARALESIRNTRHARRLRARAPGVRGRGCGLGFRCRGRARRAVGPSARQWRERGPSRRPVDQISASKSTVGTISSDAARARSAALTRNTAMSAAVCGSSGPTVTVACGRPLSSQPIAGCTPGERAEHVVEVGRCRRDFEATMAMRSHPLTNRKDRPLATRTRPHPPRRPGDQSAFVHVRPRRRWGTEGRDHLSRDREAASERPVSLASTVWGNIEATKASRGLRPA